MASHVFVISSDMRRAQIKVTPNTFIIDILEAACAKFNVSSDRYQLKNGNRQLNLTDPFRTAGLIQGAKLDLVVKSKSPSVVTVALRLPDSEHRLGLPNNRVSDRFRSDTTLWRVLRHFEDGVGKQKGLNLTARGVPSTGNDGRSGSGQLYWEAPVLRIAGRELSGLADLQKTLSQVGIDAGSQLIMVEFRVTDKTLQEAMQNADQYMTETEATPAPAPTSKAPEKKTEALAPEAQQQAVTSTFQETETIGTKEEAPLQTDGAADPSVVDNTPLTQGAMDVDRSFPPPTHSFQPLEVWAPTASAIPAAAQRAEEEVVFAPTIAQMKAHQAHLKSGTHNQRLKSDKELEAERAAAQARRAAVRRVDIRVRFPDGHMARWAFGPEATGATLYAAVREALATPDIPFKLTLPASGGDIRDASSITADHLIQGYGLQGGVVVTLIVLGEDGGKNARDRSFLRQNVLSQAHEVVVPEVPEGKAVEEEVETPIKAETSVAGGSKNTGRPKWFKFGKK